MRATLRILSLEDDPNDAELVQETLASDGISCQITRVETEADFIASLEQERVDLILADHTLPSFDGLTALKIARKGWPHVPFIFVSGTLGEEVAIEALKVGATDYVFKTRLSRIVPSVRRALREAAERIELRHAEEALRRSEAYLAEAQRLSHTRSFGWDVTSGEINWSLETFRIFEYELAAKVTIEQIVQRTHPEDRWAVEQLIDRVSRDRTDFDFEHRLLMPDGSVKYLRVVGHPSENESGSFEFVGAVTDITERKRAEAMQVEARVSERTRIARDLHDTLLQSFQGVLMKLSGMTYLLPDRPAEAQKTLETAIEQARQAITEGRDAVQALRSSTVVTNDLARAIGSLGEELGADQTGQNCPEFHLQVEGTSRDLAPLVRDEVHHVAFEALRNAFRHAQARRIEVEIQYGDRQFRLRVRDNGKGIDPKVLSEGGRTGHHGLPGMQERAKLARGKLTVFSRLDSGTEAELTIPASFAYAKSPRAGRSMSSGKGT
jgi:signal transduction histidine kinase